MSAPKNGYPSFCWHCGKALTVKRGGWVSFRLVEARDGVQHRVHNACVADAVGDGVRTVK